MDSSRQIPVPDVQVVQVSGLVDHLAGVEAELASRGLSVCRHDEVYITPKIRQGTRVVVVTDLFDPRCVRALRMARRVGAKTVLMMDGLTDWRNMNVNPLVGDSFLRPAPVDLICCSGLVDCRVLSTFGNTAVATGLPRIDAAFGQTVPVHVPGPVLVATANNPAFNQDERDRLLQSLRELKQASQWARCRLVWRLTDGLADELGVKNQQGPLARILDDCGSVITTASTLQVESMRAGKPTAILHPHDTPIWQPAAFVWQPVDTNHANDSNGVEPLVRGLTRWVDSPERLLRQLAKPTKEQMQRQRECLKLTDASSGDATAAELVAEAISELAQSKQLPSTAVALRPIARLPSHKPKRDGRRRIVSIVPFDESPIGGVTTWSCRLSDTFDRRPELGCDVHTLLVSTKPAAAHTAKPLLSDRVSLCVLDPTDDHFVTLANLRRAVELLEPDVVAPNFSDLAYAVAMQLRYSGVRTLAIAHTDHRYYQDLMTKFPHWDAAVAVSGTIERWLAPIAGRKPLDTIVYGVPASGRPRTSSKSGPIRLAYVGRITRVQKRVMDLVPLVNTLAAIGVEAELHIVGDGPDRDELTKKLQTTGSVQVKYHGGRSPEWVEKFWPTMDIAVLVSEFEGTSITMLEAMGHGVVPVVTRVASGVGDWIEEDVTGVTAPVGEPEHLARQIAMLEADRDKLATMATNAWRKVSSELGLDSMAKSYAALIHSAMTNDLATRPSLAGVTIGEWPIWNKLRTEDSAGEIAWLQTRLAEAGYQSVAVNKPTEGTDAVILPAELHSPDETMIRSWRASGIDVVWSSLVRNGGVLTEQLRLIASKGYSRIAIFGLGQHTKRFAEHLEASDYPIVGYIDDNPPKAGRVFGLPAVTPADALCELQPDCVLLSSDAWEEELWKKTSHIRDAGVKVQTIYNVYDDSAVQVPQSC
jgi:glycosyltransferase involved in cell wall biosynthesis